MERKLEGKVVLIFLEDKYEELELFYPRYRLIEEGARVIVVAPKKQETYVGKHGYPCKSDLAFQDIKSDEFDALYIPGGYAPDKLRTNPQVLELVRQFYQKEKPIGFICHAGSVLASAKILQGNKCTSWLSIKDDLIHAGAQWVDEPVVIDKQLISSRCPDDLPLFCPAFIEVITHAMPINLIG